MAKTLRVCPSCWTPYHPGTKRCPRCGFDLQQEETTSFIDLFGPPKVLRRYQIQDTLASSRVGHIYQAVDLQTHTPCVIKELLGAALLDQLEAEKARERLERRVRQLSRLTHPNLVRIHTCLSEGSRYFVIMDLVEGPTLEEVLKRRDRPIPEPIALRWGAQLCDALGYLHSQDPPLLFPDLSPHHVILSSDFQPILVDLGLTRLFEGRGGSDEGVAGDVAALGALLYRVLTLREANPPSARRLPLQQVNPQVSVSTAKVIAQALSRHPEERFASMPQFKEALLAQAPAVEAPMKVVPFIEPYEVAPGRWARSLQELIQLCQEEWDRGVEQFFEGALTVWLRGVADRLQEAGQEKAAREVSAAAERGERLRREAERAGLIQRQKAFYQWLTSTGYVWGEPQLELGTSYLRLGAVKGEMRLGAIFNVKNTGMGFLTGEVRSQVGWLLVRKREFGCRAGEAAQITVVLRNRSALLRPVSSAQALHITSNGGEAWIGVSISAPRPMLALDRHNIDFGKVQAGEPAHAVVTIRNDGGGLLTGRVSSTVLWLRPQPTIFHCPAGSAVTIDVKLQVELLPVGSTIRESALIVDSDYGQARVDVKVIRVQPQLELSPEELDFGTVAPVYRISRTLRVTNSGTGYLEGMVISEADWLTVEQPTFRCRPKETALITVWADPALLSEPQVELPKGLIIESNGGLRAISIRLAVRRPLLHVDQKLLDFGTLLPGQERALPLRVENWGTAPLHVELVPHMEWLAVEPAQITCEGGEVVEVNLLLRVPAGAQGGVLQVDRALHLASDGGVAHLDLRAEIVSPRLEVDPHHLDFGLIGPSEVVQGQLHLRNEGSGMLEWHLRGEFTWLEVSPRQGRCAPGEMVDIQVNGFALALPAGTTSAQEALRIESNGGQFEVPITVAIAAPTLTVLPLLLDLGTSENYAPLQEKLRIANHGGGHLTGSVSSQVEWLRVEPSSFDCTAGMMADITVSADPQGLPEGETFVPDALLVVSNGGQERVGMRLKVLLKPILEVTPEVLTFSVGAVEENVLTERLILTNRGYGALRVRFQPTAEWITTDRGSRTLRHGRHAWVKVSLDVAAWREAGGEGQEAALDIRAGRDTLASIPIIIEK